MIVACVTLSNPLLPELEELEVHARVDSGMFMLCIPEHVALQLKLEKLEDREVTLADGKKQVVPFVGPVQLRFENRGTFVGAMVLGNQVLMGVIPMEDMDLVISPSRQTVTVNPESPNIPATIVMGVEGS